jgi:hypothetical protein
MKLGLTTLMLAASTALTACATTPPRPQGLDSQNCSVFNSVNIPLLLNLSLDRVSEGCHMANLVQALSDTNLDERTKLQINGLAVLVADHLKSTNRTEYNRYLRTLEANGFAFDEAESQIRPLIQQGERLDNAARCNNWEVGPMQRRSDGSFGYSAVCRDVVRAPN